jgi:hypothetical protein
MIIGFTVGMLVNDGSDESLTRSGVINLVIAIIWRVSYAGFGYGVLTLFELYAGTLLAHYTRFKN